MDEDPGLRARKKERTRRHITRTAARLFGTHGFEQVTVAEIARAAEVSTQTVFNYFPTKQDLVLDREVEVRDRLVRLVAERPADVSPSEALRDAAHEELTLLRARSTDETVGDLSMLCATSATVRRLTLEALDRQADAVADAIVATTPSTHPWAAKVRATALLAVFGKIIDHTGRRLLESVEPAAIADELVTCVDAAFDDLDRWPTPPRSA